MLSSVQYSIFYSSQYEPHTRTQSQQHKHGQDLTRHAYQSIN